MEVFAEFLNNIDNPEHRARMEEVLSSVIHKFPDLVPVIKWNQPMFTHHGTYIIGFSTSKKHMAVSPESAGMIHFSEEISQAGYDQTKQLIRIPWNHPVDYELLAKMIQYNLEDKADCTTFWR
ncbi:iron chaperone [Paenibacillus lemnae]|uniref:Iron chaperone n=1 Tax=Paenibacillus lemnae TaxID=1330551 RepID=A0A848M225_PAELE|nr:iron chaperone [Paenibacillus lemnae]NMO94290.1 iron chaperone [Paenibacillus lemnae]